MAYWCSNHRIPLLPKIFFYLQFFLFNSIVHPQTKIGKGSKFAYGGMGVVIHKDAVIGNNVIIGQGITIGGKSKKNKIPIIGNNVYLGAGCRILGDVIIGDNVIIGPNSVVVKNIPSSCIAVGIPATIIKEGIKVEDFV